MTRYTKEDAIRIVASCAEKYRDELVGKTLLFVCMDKHKRVSCIEFSFNTWNFLHLTGLKVQRRNDEEAAPELENEANIIAAADFFNRCLAQKLSPNDFEFSEDGTTHMKLNVLSSVLSKNLSASMIGDYNSMKPRLYTEKLAGGTKACMGFVVDNISGKYVPNTVLKEDIRENVKDYVRVVAVYRKEATAEKYTELTYRAKKVDLAEIAYPEDYAYLHTCSTT